ncbi:AgmX/PglI C-terminal domain-containing protein [Hyalangium versicolor]|uniref:AgmX/PglI C-terminal domain-containing protein n=1 Tax=Hyalangium versicolor TaxID=2861190 RepID=UPI001CCFC38C|nr:AgmX/PglI C-terminal domain-containing protein [Hyalangium versicolor]
MNFSCDKCQRRYSIADEKVRGKTVKIRCKNCQNVISVQGPPAEMEESTRVVSLADVERIREQERALSAASSAPAAATGGNPWEEEPTRAAPPRPAAAPWFVMVKSKQEGPLDEAGLRALADSGAINPRSFFWQQGMADWKRGADLAELAGVFAAPAAPEPAPAPPVAPEPATVAARGQRGAAARAQPVQEEEDRSWDNVPTTVGRAPAAAAKEPWDLDPPAAEQPQGRQAQRQQQPTWDFDAPAEPAQQAQPEQQAWDEPQQDQPAEEEQQDQPAWDEPEQPQQQHAEEPQENSPWDEPTERPAARASGGNGSAKAAVADDLFSDLDLPDKSEQMDDGEPPTSVTGEPDPLDSVRGKPGKDDKKPVQDTRYFMAKSGVTKRNPVWKVALFILMPIVLLVGGAFALDRLNLVPKVTVVNAQGKPEQKSLLFSGEGVSELRDRLLGKTKAPPPAPVPAPGPASNDKKPQGGTPPKTEPGSVDETKAGPDTGKSAEELKALYGDAAKAEVAPEVRQDAEVAAKDAESKGGLPAEDVAKVVEKSHAAFQGCVETELRKNPKFKGGKVMLVATVGTSGVVKGAKLDRKELDGSPVGTCIKNSAKRMVFPTFKLEDGSGEMDVEIPLVLSSGSM